MNPGPLLLILFLVSATPSTKPSTVPQQPEYLCPGFALVGAETQSRRTEMSFKVVFTSGGAPSAKTTYTWHVTAGKIVAGQGTQMIKVDASKVRKNRIKATLKVGGFPSACPLVASYATRLTKP